MDDLDRGDDRSNAQNPSSQSRGQKQSSPPRHDENPFITFRRYADQQVSSFLQSIVGLPSTILTPPNKDWQVFHDRDLKNALGRWRRTPDDEYNETNGQGDGTRRDDSSRVGGSGNSDYGERPCPPKRPRRRDHIHAFPSSAFDPILSSVFGFPDFLTPFAFDNLSPNTPAGWPMGYLLFSPYSPIHLELQEQLQHSNGDNTLAGWFAPLASSTSIEKRNVNGLRWREAFEDLLRATNGQQMLDSGFTAEKDELGTEWLSGMIKRGSLGEGWAHIRSPNGPKGDCFKFTPPKGRNGDAAWEPDASWTGPSELSVYDLFLHQANQGFDEDDVFRSGPVLRALEEGRRRQERAMEDRIKSFHDGRKKRAAYNHDNRPQDDLTSQLATNASRNPRQVVMDLDGRTNSSAPSSETTPSSKLVSTTTKTERRGLPDGSTRTKTVVNKRFADGREESVETDEVTHDNQSNVAFERDAQNTASSNNNGETSASEGKEKGGWFWRR